MVSRSRSTTVGMNSARQNTATPVNSSATATAMITPLSIESPYAACRRSSRSVPPSAPGIEPTPSHRASGTSTVPWRKWRQPPTVLVTAA